MSVKKLTVYLSEDELKAIRVAAAIEDKSRTEFCKDAALQLAHQVTKSAIATMAEHQKAEKEPKIDLRHTWYDRMTPERREWFSQRTREGMASKKAQADEQQRNQESEDK